MISDALAFLQEMAAIWWLWLIVAFVMAGSAAFSGMFALASGTAFGTHYHTLTSRQRWMSRFALYSAIVTCFFTTLVAVFAGIYCVVVLLN